MQIRMCQYQYAQSG